MLTATLIELDVGITHARARYVQHLRGMLPAGDPLNGITEMTAKAMAKLAVVSGTFTGEYVEAEVKRSLDWLNAAVRNESCRYAAVCVLKELANNCPTFFFQHVQQFFDSIFVALFDLKAYVREKAAEAIRSAVGVTAQRENRELQRPSCYTNCYNNIIIELRSKTAAKEERIHGSLLVLCELLRCSNADAERVRTTVEEELKQQSDTDFTTG